MEAAAVVFLAGEWVPAGLGFSITFLVAGLGVVGLGWWVLRGDARNRAAEEAAEKPAEEAAEKPAESEPAEVHH